MSLRIALPHSAAATRATRSRAGLSSDQGTPLYLGGILLVVLFAAIVWAGLF